MKKKAQGLRLKAKGNKKPKQPVSVPPREKCLICGCICTRPVISFGSLTGDGVRRIHDLKCWPEPFSAALSGDKRFEIRKNDRGYMVGDVLWLREWDPSLSSYTGRAFRARVTYLCQGTWGLPSDVCVMGIEREKSVEDFLPPSLRKGLSSPRERALELAANSIYGKFAKSSTYGKEKKP